MDYKVHIIHSAEKEIGRLPAVMLARVSQRILSLEDNPYPRGVRKLSGREEYRIRAGDYRVLYVVNDKKHIVTIIAVGHRRDVYR